MVHVVCVIDPLPPPPPQLPQTTADLDVLYQDYVVERFDPKPPSYAYATRSGGGSS